MIILHAFQQHSACSSAWYAQHNVHQLLCKTLNFISLELYGAQQARTELS